MLLAAAERLVGGGQHDALEPGQGIAGVDEVPQVPVPARRKGRARRKGEAGGPAAPGCEQAEPDREGCGGRQVVDLGSGRQAGRDPDRGQRAPGQRLVPGPGGPGVGRDRRGGEQEEDRRDVVAGLARLVGEGARAEHQRGPRHRGRPGAPRPPDAPGGDQAPRQPGEAEQRREDVPPEGEDAGGVQQLGALRVEPGEILGRDQLQVEGRAALYEPGGERPVVPGRVEAGHPGPEADSGADREMGDDDGRDGEPGDERQAPGARRRRRGKPAGPRGAAGPAAGRRRRRRRRSGTASPRRGRPCRGARPTQISTASASTAVASQPGAPPKPGSRRPRSAAPAAIPPARRRASSATPAR